MDAIQSAFSSAINQQQQPLNDDKERQWSIDL